MSRAPTPFMDWTLVALGAIDLLLFIVDAILLGLDTALIRFAGAFLLIVTPIYVGACRRRAKARQL